MPKFNPEKEDLAGASVSDEVMKEMWEALGDSPIGAVLQSFGYLVCLNTISSFSLIVMATPW